VSNDDFAAAPASPDADAYADADADSGPTILVPRPGAARSAAFMSGVTGGAPPLAAYASGLNPLLRASNPLIEVALMLRALPAHADVEELRMQLVQMVRAFETQAGASGYDEQTLGAAHYCLCTFVDEAVSSTPWGAGVWGARSLLVIFHNDTAGGERFFLVLQRYARDPKAHVDLLEQLYVFLSLGFEGRYHLLGDGRAQRESVRERLADLIGRERGEPERALSPRWQPQAREQKPLSHLMPVWVCGALAAVALVTLNLGLSLRLNAVSDPVFEALHAIRVAPQPAATRHALPGLPPSPAAPELTHFLAPEIARGLVRVSTLPGRTTVLINGDGLFASGSAQPDPATADLMARIGDALTKVQGRVIVAGHTDNQRMLSARFPSNWHLSQARAETVAALLAARTGTPQRFSAEGRGDTEPVASNDTPAGRARNRRVEIVVLAPGTMP